MSYYVSARVLGTTRQAALLVGPFRRHGEALAMVSAVEEYVQASFAPDPFLALGTAHHRAGHPPARLNKALGLTLDPAGYIPNRG